MTPRSWAESQLVAYFKGVIDERDLKLVKEVLLAALNDASYPDERRELFLLLGITLAQGEIGLLPPHALSAAHEFFGGNSTSFYVAVQELRDKLKKGQKRQTSD